jgi:hypothetical protein
MALGDCCLHNHGQCVYSARTAGWDTASAIMAMQDGGTQLPLTHSAVLYCRRRLFLLRSSGKALERPPALRRHRLWACHQQQQAQVQAHPQCSRRRPVIQLFDLAHWSGDTGCGGLQKAALGQGRQGITTSIGSPWNNAVHQHCLCALSVTPQGSRQCGRTEALRVSLCVSVSVLHIRCIPVQMVNLAGPTGTHIPRCACIRQMHSAFKLSLLDSQAHQSVP